jgi:hypothetical protein
MHELKDALERIEPTPEERGDWDEVVRLSGVRPGVALARWSVALGTVAAALFALVLFQPWQSESRTLLERALAAVDDGPVLHVVLRGDWGGTLVDLETGARTPVHGETETWFDAERGLVHHLSRLGDFVQHEAQYETGEAPPDLAALGRDYRKALESGSARIAGEDVIDGQPATWITYLRRMLPDSSDGKQHEFVMQVAVSHETFRPVATRDMRDGRPGPSAPQRVLELETLPAGEGDFTAPDSIEGRAFTQGRTPIELGAAAATLGRAPLWLEREHSGLKLAQVSETFIQSGRQEEREITGSFADDALACQAQVERGGGRSGAACERMRAARRWFSIRGGKVFGLGRVEWGEKETGVALFYGTTGDDPSTYRSDVVPLGDRPHVTVTQSTRLGAFRSGSVYPAPPGSVFIGAGGRTGSLRLDGLYVEIEASSEELILSAARALEPMPSS